MFFEQGLYFFFFKKKFLLFNIVLLKCFDYSRVKATQILRRAAISVTKTENQVQAISIHLIQKEFPSFQVITTNPQEKTNHKENHVYLTESLYPICLLKKHSRLQHLSQSGHLKTCNTSGFLFLLVFIVSSSLSTTHILHR